jgi:hypothetical protein
MTKTTRLATLFVVLAMGVAHAGGQEGSIGVGAEYQLNGLTGGASLNYDAGQFHVGGFFSFSDPSNNNNDHYLSLGGRFFYHVHSTAMSDFGVGMGLGIVNVPDPTMMNPDNRATGLFIEPSVQIRLFLASNVALSFTAGLVIGTLDADGVVFDGQGLGGGGTVPTGLAGVHYYFF